MEPFGVKLPDFEGPLDLLLHLVRKEKLDIRTVSVSMVAHQYLQYLQRMTVQDLGLLAEYLLLAATLLYLKSKALLPEPEEQKEAEELEQDLTERLIRYEAFRRAAEELGRRPMLLRDVFPREPLPVEEDVEGEIQADLPSLLEAARRLLGSRPPQQRPIRPPQGFDLRRKMEELLRRLRALGSLKLDPSREVLPLFMAALELAKRGAVSLFQEEPFSSLWISLRWDGVKEEVAS